MAELSRVHPGDHQSTNQIHCVQLEVLTMEISTSTKAWRATFSETCRTWTPREFLSHNLKTLTHGNCDFTGVRQLFSVRFRTNFTFSVFRMKPDNFAITECDVHSYKPIVLIAQDARACVRTHEKIHRRILRSISRLTSVIQLSFSVFFSGFWYIENASRLLTQNACKTIWFYVVSYDFAMHYSDWLFL